MSLTAVLFPRPFTMKEYGRKVADSPRDVAMNYEDMMALHEKSSRIARSIPSHLRVQQVLKAVYHPIEFCKKYF